MALEIFTFITSLVRTNPTGLDGVNQGDDHIRGFKQAVQDSFPNVDDACTFTPTEINSWEARIVLLEAFEGRIEALELANASYTKLSQVENEGVLSGTFTAGVRQVRVLNTKEFDPAGDVSLLANQFTLQPGTWRIRAAAPSYLTSNDKCFLNNVTEVIPEYITGESGNFTGTQSNSGGAKSRLQGQFTIAIPTVFELTHEGVVTRTSNGLGTASDSGGDEVYAVVELWKIA